MSAVLLLPVLLPVTVGLLAYVLLTDSPRHRAMMALVAAATVLVSILAVLPKFGPGARFAFAEPALEIRFDLAAPLAARTPLVIAGILEILGLVALGFALPRALRSREHIFIFLLGAGIVNGIILARKDEEIVLFVELLAVTLFAVVALLALISSYRVSPGALGWASSRISSFSGTGFVRLVGACANAVYVLVDRGIDAVYEKVFVVGSRIVTGGLQAAHDGLYARYLSWAIGGFLLLVWFLTRMLE